MKITNDLLRDIYKNAIGNHIYYDTIDFLIDNSRRNDFFLNGRNQICFYINTFLVISFDTLNNNEIYINTNLLQITKYELDNAKKWSDWKTVNLEYLEYKKNSNLILNKIRKDKLKQLNENRG